MKINNKIYDIKASFNKKIVLISDIHYDNKKNLKHLYKVIRHIKKIKPDYICIAGDFINRTDIKTSDLFISWLSSLALVSEVIISVGNHDISQFGKKNDCTNKDLFSKIRKINNVHFLDNEIYKTPDIDFIGLTFPFDYYYTYGENVKYVHECVDDKFVLDSKKYNILLCHTPYPITQLSDVKLFNECNLILSGHMHGGVVPNLFRVLFKSRGIFSPVKSSRRFFCKDMYGYIKEKNLIISSGITKLSDNVRIKFLNRVFDSEVVIINLRK